MHKETDSGFRDIASTAVWGTGQLACRKHSGACGKHSGRDMQELQRVEKNMGEDYRLNYRLDKECHEDAEAICGQSVCDRNPYGGSCGGTVLRCLVENKADIKNENCKREVFYFIKMEVCTTEVASQTPPPLVACSSPILFL